MMTVNLILLSSDFTTAVYVLLLAYSVKLTKLEDGLKYNLLIA